MTTDWIKTTARECRRRAGIRWGSGWALLSDDQREAFIALEVVRILLVQDEGHAHEQVKKLQSVARAALDGTSR